MCMVVLLSGRPAVDKSGVKIIEADIPIKMIKLQAIKYLLHFFILMFTLHKVCF